MKQVKHWQDPVNAVLGAWLILSPWAAAYSGDAVATGNAVVVGVVLIAAALGAMLVPRAWEEWTEAALGMWLMASPWALGYAGLGDAMRVATANQVCARKPRSPLKGQFFCLSEAVPCRGSHCADGCFRPDGKQRYEGTMSNDFTGRPGVIFYEW